MCKAQCGQCSFSNCFSPVVNVKAEKWRLDLTAVICQGYDLHSMHSTLWVDTVAVSSKLKLVVL